MEWKQAETYGAVSSAWTHEKWRIEESDGDRPFALINLAALGSIVSPVVGRFSTLQEAKDRAHALDEDVSGG